MIMEDRNEFEAWLARTEWREADSDRERSRAMLAERIAVLACAIVIMGAISLPAGAWILEMWQGIARALQGAAGF